MESNLILWLQPFGDGLWDGADEYPLINDALVSPHEAGLPVSASKDLVALWDFESSGVGPGGVTTFNSALPLNGPSCHTFGATKWARAQGLVSHGADLRGFVSALQCSNGNLLKDKEDLSIVISMRLTKDSLLNRTERMDIFAFGGTTNQWSQTEGIPNLHAYFTTDGKIRMSNYIHGLPAFVNGPPTEIESHFVEWDIQKKVDDGLWHQFAFIRNDRTHRIFIDGEQVGSPKNGGDGLDFRPNARYFMIGSKQLWRLNAPQSLDAIVDRIRIYDDNITAETVSALYNQDADLDGLYDRTEGPSLKWVDRNDNDSIDSGESFYILNPFRADPNNADHDEDGIFSLDEQNIHNTLADIPDTDGDFLMAGRSVIF